MHNINKIGLQIGYRGGGGRGVVKEIQETCASPGIS